MTPIVHLDDKAGEGESMESELLDQPLDALHLSERPLSCLRRVGITTVRALVQRSSNELLEVTNFGELSLREVRDALWKVDLWLRDGRWGEP